MDSNCIDDLFRALEYQRLHEWINWKGQIERRPFFNKLYVVGNNESITKYKLVWYSFFKQNKQTTTNNSLPG